MRLSTKGGVPLSWPVVLLPAFIVIGAALWFFIAPYLLEHFDPRILLGFGKDRTAMRVRCEVVGYFLRGLAAGIFRETPRINQLADDCSAFSRPFTLEGICSGMYLRQQIDPFRKRESLATFWQRHQNHHFLLTIGLGFAAGMARLRPSLPTQRGSLPDPRLDSLWLDGFGFAQTIFGFRMGRSMRPRGDWGTAQRKGYYEGVGRALWFILPAAIDFSSMARDLAPEHAVDLATGYGIAAGFAGCRDANAALIQLESLETQYKGDFATGLFIGLFARSYTNHSFLSETLSLQQQPALLEGAHRAGELYDSLWDQGHTYMEWREALRNTAIPELAWQRAPLLDEAAPAYTR